MTDEKRAACGDGHGPPRAIAMLVREVSAAKCLPWPKAVDLPRTASDPSGHSAEGAPRCNVASHCRPTRTTEQIQTSKVSTFDASGVNASSF